MEKAGDRRKARTGVDPNLIIKKGAARSLLKLSFGEQEWSCTLVIYEDVLESEGLTAMQCLREVRFKIGGHIIAPNAG